MRSVRLHKAGDIRFENIDFPDEPGPNEVRVAVAFAGICGSDIHNYNTGQWISRASTAGHEFAGVIDKVGRNVKDLKAGDQIVADSRYYCDTCENCLTKDQHLCKNLGFIGEAIDGGFAEYVTLPEKLVLKCGQDTRLDIAALAEPLAVGLHALSRMEIEADQPLLIVGCGPIGALSAIASAVTSSRPLLVSDINSDRQALVAQLANAQPMSLTDFDQFQNPTGQVIRNALDTTGNIGVISQLISQMTGSKICLVGIGAGKIGLDPVELVEKENSLLGVHAFKDELKQAVELLAKYPERFRSVIGPYISLEATPKSYAQLSKGQSSGIKTMIEIAMNQAEAEKPTSRTAFIRALAGRDQRAAEAELVIFLADVFNVEIDDLSINQDQYSLNSLNGFLSINNEPFFFKFHQEDGEENMSGEYYRADLIEKAKLPIDMPVMTSTRAGEQVLIYRRRNDRRFSDVLRELDLEDDPPLVATAADAERRLNAKILKVAKDTLHPVSISQVSAEPINRLFFERMIDPETGKPPGGRFAEYYLNKTFEFSGASVHWQELSTAKLVLNGQIMSSTISKIFSDAAELLKPTSLTGAGGITAHGDAHNANVWFETAGETPTLTYFDPAFAGEHVPSLLAEAKATFHNVFAHPLWLYDPNLAMTRFEADATYQDGVLHIETNWELSEVRRALLDAKATSFWAPFLNELQTRGLLPKNWRETLRSALAMCPALVMNLRAGADRHNVCSSAIAFYVLGLVGSESQTGTNTVSDFLDTIDPNKGSL
jgi:threonine dehydrogenase-like Zn-dependent dehydrogenase